MTALKSDFVILLRAVIPREMDCSGYTLARLSLTPPFRRRLLILGAITALAAVLRFYHLAARSFWFDEVFSVQAARLPLSQLARLLWERESNMALYYLLLRGWLLLGHGEFFIRALSVLLGIAAIPACYALGTRLFGHRAGIFASALLALNAFHLRYSQEARAYSMAMLLVMLSTLLFVEAVRGKGSGPWLGYAILSALAVYAHLFAILVIAAQWISLLALPRADFSPRQWFRSVRFLFYLILPLGAAALHSGAVPVQWVGASSWAQLVFFGLHFSGNAGYVLLALYLICIVWAVYALLGSGRSAQAWHYGLLLAWLWTPILSIFVISAWRPSFVERYLIVALPPLVLIGGAALAAVPRAWFRYAMVALMLALTAWGIPSAYRPSFFPNVTEEDYRSAITVLTSHARPDDGVFFYVAPGRAAYDYYTWLHPPAAAPRVLYPAHGPDRQYEDLIAGPLAELPPVPADTPRVWLLLSGYRDSAGRPDRGSVIVLSWLQRRLQLTEVYNFPGVELFLFESRR